jgi:cobalamin biosynthesis protein CbiG
MAAGIVVRELAPLLGSKHSDPAVVVVDARGTFAVSLLGGHEGGANRLAREVAGITGGQAVITTASDGQGIPALDVLARDAGWVAHPRSRLATVMAATVNGEPVGIVADDGCDWPADAASPWWVRCDDWQAGRDRGLGALVLLTTREPAAELWDSFRDVAVYHPRSLVVGVGCNRGTPAGEIRDAIVATLRDAGLAQSAIACLATVTAKADEPGLVDVARVAGWPLAIVSGDDIRDAGEPPNPSEHARRALGVPGVAEPAAMLVAGSPSLLVPKRRFANVTVAVAMKAATPAETTILATAPAAAGTPTAGTAAITREAR